MSRLRFLAMATMLAGIVVPVHAAALSITSWVFDFDENGTGSIDLTYSNATTSGFIPFNGTVAHDPTSTIGNALIWNFATLTGFTTGFNEGDVLVQDPTVIAAVSSDLLRFADANGGTSGTNFSLFIFYSADVSGGLLADTGLPSVHGSSVGPTEDATGHFTYSPTPNTYNGFSGAVPEPATFATLGFGLAALGLVARRKKLLTK
jgi:hypothetical protein